MAAPNVVNTATMTLEVSAGALTTSAATLVNNAASSNTAVKIVSLYVSNIDGAASADVTISYYTLDDIGGTAYALASTVAVPADSTVVIIDESSPVYLAEDSSLGGLASAAGDLQYVVSYQIINDA